MVEVGCLNMLCARATLFFYLLLLQLGLLGCRIAKYETHQDAKIPFLLNPSNETN